jgi:pimeloyl-ACP methyl ester carboxylesterase
MLALTRFDVRDRLKTLKVPTLVITGDADTTILPRRQKQLTVQIPHARQVQISGAGHAVTVEYPDQTNDLILEFLQNDRVRA